MLHLSVSAIRARWSEAINRVAFGGERVAVERHGKPVAYLLGAEDLEGLLRRLKDAERAVSQRFAKAEPATRRTRKG
jgi:prevent-host-death family protein